MTPTIWGLGVEMSDSKGSRIREPLESLICSG